jgi:hypothetical protein
MASKNFTFLRPQANTVTENKLIKCMETLLQSLDYSYIQSYSISTVPKELKKSSKDDAYLPRVVSMGPRFKGSREELMHMEEIKLRCMLSLLHRVEEGKVVESLTNCCILFCNLNEKIRASYVADINLDDQELAKIMLVDGCFLLELLITKRFNDELPSHLIITTPTASQVLENDDVLSDLTLFENQIPIFIIHELCEILFPHYFKQDRNQRAATINNLALSIFGYSLSNDQSLQGDPSHLLDVVHTFVNNKYEVCIDMDGTQSQNVNAMMELKLKRCATTLQAAGISIQLAQEKGVTGLDFEFKFKEGKLEIGALIITKTTKAKWRNVIAWEHNRKRTSSNSNNCGKFTSAALIFNDLICCANDVKLLKNKNIIVDYTKKSNKELEEFFNTMTLGVEPGEVGSSCYGKMVDELNKYYPTTYAPIRIWNTLCHRLTLTYRLEWFFKFMKKDYHFVAAVISLLTVVQTVYALIAYHLPN